MNGTPFYGLDFINGAWAPDDGGNGAAMHWRQYARIKKLRLAFNGKTLFDIALADANRWQSVFFDDILLASGDTMTLEILEVYPAAAGPDQPVAVSEIVLQGAH
jgi:hypothetical protein